MEYALITVVVLAIAYVIYRFNKKRKNIGNSGGSSRNSRLK